MTTTTLPSDEMQVGPPSPPAVGKIGLIVVGSMTAGLIAAAVLVRHRKDILPTLAAPFQKPAPGPSEPAHPALQQSR